MDLTVEIAQGTVRGREADGIASFKGVPYAQAPFGANRFREPTAPPSWEGEFDAGDFGPTPPAPGYLPPMNDILPAPMIDGDDCLNLNIWTPDLTASSPVLVWIHGGAFVNGNGAIPTYDGAAFARDGIVLVSINYRLGAEGFAHIEGAPDNRGLLDQVAALKWVQANIAVFGGDPTTVTIMGESAGAMSVATLMSMPRADGLFTRAILQSGAGHHVISAESARKVADALATFAGVPATVDGLSALSPADLVAAQAKVSASVAQEPMKWGEVALNTMAFEPHIDGDVVPGRPIDRILDGEGAVVDVLIGSNTDEIALFLVPAGMTDYVTEDLVRMTLTGYGADVEKVLGAYREVMPDASAGHLMIAIMTDWVFRIPALRIAENQASYVYEFGWRSSLFDGKLGAAHAVEIGFAFDNLDGSAGITGPHPPQELADDMHRAWVAFARDGKPGWELYGPERSVKFFPGDVVDDPGAATREVWDGVR
ncbi:carboxylic ester hydrolase [Rhodococcoides trifolii]|uniref:Carboxylic ester hydrolase n=1 Tax=Rhodococcoides trifolii TaxID=908250 RepID=A0A917CSQ9_9NOCA|nr:carboxylesterase family protein [Rhodococcus trifolii]GGF95701.1 carboxylic ester hydrolase [Rhodococcus trifolii]